MQDSELLRRLHETYHAPVDAPIHEAVHGPIRDPDWDGGMRQLFRDRQPGTRAFADIHLTGSAAPEPIIERYDGIGAEDFGPVELIDGRTGQKIARVNRHMRKRLDAS
jgi:hypothetical protein